MIAVVDYQKGNLLSVQRGLAAVGGQAVVTSDPAEIAVADAIVLPGVGAFADAAATLRELGQVDVIRDRVLAGVPFLGICLGMHLMFEQGIEGSPAERAAQVAGAAGAAGAAADVSAAAVVEAAEAVGEGTVGVAASDSAADAEYAQGLGLIPGLVAALPREDAQGRSYKIPHVGWNEVSFAAIPAAAPATCCQITPPFVNNSLHATNLAANEQQPVSSSRISARSSTVASAAVSAKSALFDGIPEGEYFYFTHSYVSPDSTATIATTTHSITFPCAVQLGQRAFGVQFHPEKSSDAGLALLRNFVTIAQEA